MLLVYHEGYAPQEVPVAGQTNLTIRMTPNTIRGTVTGSDGKPVGGALVINGAVQALTGADGSFLLRDITPNPAGMTWWSRRRATASGASIWPSPASNR